jgi:hypothetical protein
MGSLFGGGGSSPKVIPEFTGLQVNTAVQVLPVPIIWGAPRVSINMIYYNGFKSQIVSQRSGGGKGILSGGKGGSGGQTVEYFATIILAIGEGPISQPFIIYQDQEVWTPETYPTNGTNWFAGTPTQSPWSYVEAEWPNDARPYVSTAYYGFPNAQLDSSATVPQINMVPGGFRIGSSPLNYSTIEITSGQYDPNGNPLSYLGPITLGCCDADPAYVIYDFLTDDQYGANFPVEFIDQNTLFTSANGYNINAGDNALSTFCQAVGLAWSVAVNNVETASSILDRWCQNLNTAIVWNGALLKFIPYWDQYEVNNPGWYEPAGMPKKYYTPYYIPCATITLDQILQSESKDEDPITFTRKDPWEVYNTVRLEFKDRTNFFNANPVEAKDEALVELYGPRVDNIGQGDEFTLQTYANVSVQMQLRRQAAIRRTYTWRMGPMWGFLDPMDILQIPDPVNFTNQILVRIQSIEDDEDENLTIVAEEYPVGAQSPTSIPMSPTTPPNQGIVNSPPSPIYQPFMFAVPSAMQTAQGYPNAQWIFGVSAGLSGAFDTNWGGCNIWVSLDNVSYQSLGTLVGPSTIGSLAASLPGYSGANPDNVHTLTVNLSECDGALVSVSSSAAAAGASICCLQDVSGFEILAYTTATLVGPNTYALTGLYRGLYGTTSRAWGIGSQFLYLGSGSNNFETSVLPGYVGMTFYVKGQSFNVFNNATQDLSDCVAYEYILGGTTPQPPTPPPSITIKNTSRGVAASTQLPRVSGANVRRPKGPSPGSRGR